MFASEIIRQQVLYAQEQGLPVVVSMGSVAASGGYYIAAPADEIWATEGTITGSIGVFAAFPTFEKLLQRVGVYTDGVGTTELAGSLRVDRPLNPEVVDAINSGVAFAYRKFLQVVAEGRDLPQARVEELAQGRVWSAGDALEGGLVDKLGSLDEAVAAAASLAGITDYDVEYVELPLSPRDQILKQLANRSAHFTAPPGGGAQAVLRQLMLPVERAAQELQLLTDPRHLYLRCLGCAQVH